MCYIPGSWELCREQTGLRTKKSLLKLWNLLMLIRHSVKHAFVNWYSPGVQSLKGIKALENVGNRGTIEYFCWLMKKSDLF